VANNYCTILRTFTRKQSIYNMATGALVGDMPVQIYTEPCNVPLFYYDNREKGVCRWCQQGWESESNKFANEQERLRAMEK
jgi:hypothetical protein